MQIKSSIVLRKSGFPYRTAQIISLLITPNFSFAECRAQTAQKTPVDDYAIENVGDIELVSEAYKIALSRVLS